MKITNHHNLSPPIVKALSRDDYTRGKSHRSVTQLIDSPQVRILRERHWDDLTEDVSEKMWTVLGTAVHRIFEDHAGGSSVVLSIYKMREASWITNATACGQSYMTRSNGSFS